ncbi:hypothetical protein FOA52_014660 [Chlamydomonas sp. UWO 241]|nr:hypothetical protein FOA52_014660 [Chlamydomonas sp. UWO 241]
MGCFSCSGTDGPVDAWLELSRVQLKSLYEKSLAANNGRLIVHGIFARADTKNNNKRVYPKAVLKREVSKFEREHILPGTALGELDHPNYASRYFKCLNLPNISHQVLEVHWKGDMLMGTIEILPTPSGLLLWELYSQGIKLGVSSRGWASLRTDPRQRCIYVDDDFELITFDFVTEPSTKGAYLVPVRATYRSPIPNQSKAVQTSHLGHGVCGLEHMPKLPSSGLLAQRIAELQGAQASGMHEAALALARGETPPALSGRISGPATRLAYLDKLLLYSHYIVFQDATYLDREAHARDYASHLAMFATRAHLSNQAAYMNRADLNALIMKEIAKEQSGGGSGPGGAPGLRLSPSLGNGLSSDASSSSDNKISTRPDKTQYHNAGVECQATHSPQHDAWRLAAAVRDATQPPPPSRVSSRQGPLPGDRGSGTAGASGGGIGSRGSSRGRAPTAASGAAGAGGDRDGPRGSAGSAGAAPPARDEAGAAPSGRDTMLPLPPPSAELLPGRGAAGGGGPPAAAGGGAGGRGSRVAPEPGGIAAAGAAGVSPESDVAHEFKLIRTTLERFAAKYAAFQEGLQQQVGAMAAPPPAVVGLSIAGAAH